MPTNYVLNIWLSTTELLRRLEIVDGYTMVTNYKIATYSRLVVGHCFAIWSANRKRSSVVLYLETARGVSYARNG